MSDLILNIIVPCYNEERVLPSFYRQIKKVLNKYPNAKVLFVDDGSKDETLEVLKALARDDEQIFYITFSKNFGQQTALKAGFDASIEADCVISMDADLQHPPRLIPDLISKWRDGYEIVNTIRCNTKNDTWSRRFLRYSFYSLINIVSKKKIVRNGSDYRLLDKKVVRVISEISEEGLYIKELISWVGFKHSSISFNVEERLAGNSNYSFSSLIRLSILGFTSFSTNPLRLSMIIGLLTSLIAFVYGFYALYLKLFTNSTITGWTSIIVSILFVSGVQFILIGIIGEYLGRAYIEVKKRPLYIISETNWTSDLFPEKTI